MRCKKHPADVSSSVGVCASCLREHLFAIMAAQAQKQALLHQAEQNCWKSDTLQPSPLSFPRSVSPYISRRRMDSDASAWHVHRSFYSTPQAATTGHVAVEVKEMKKKKKKRRSNGGRFSWLFLGLFGSKSDILDSGPGSDPVIPVHHCSASSSWFSTFIPSLRKKQVRTLSLDESSTRHKRCRNPDRGLSPVKFSDDDDDEHCHGGSSGYSSESSQGWRQTPRRTPATTRRGGARGSVLSRNVSGLAFCLSPLVRASPNRHGNQKGLTPEVVVAAESRVPQKPHLTTAASFCKNRSRKLADFGRHNYSKH